MAARANISRGNFLARLFGRRPKLFISYRRGDYEAARLLKAELTSVFGNKSVFRDVDDMGPGEDFPESIRRAVESCDALLVLITPGWIEARERLRAPGDYVRLEIAIALARPDALVIPVLARGVQMPDANDLPAEIRSLASRNAVEMSDRHWDDDVQLLADAIRAHLAGRRHVSSLDRAVAAARALIGSWPRGLAAALLAAAALAAAAYLYYPRPPDPLPRAPSYGECLNLLRVFSPHEVEVAADTLNQHLVALDEYALATGAPPWGLPLLVRLTDSGQDIGAVSLVYSREKQEYAVGPVVEPPCAYVEKKPAPGYARTVPNWGSLGVTLRGRKYSLRVGDHGDSLKAELTTVPETPTPAR